MSRIADILQGMSRRLAIARHGLSEWRRRARTRSELRELDARLLADIGCTDYERRCECAKPFWRA